MLFSWRMQKKKVNFMHDIQLKTNFQQDFLRSLSKAVISGIALESMKLSTFSSEEQ